MSASNEKKDNGNNGNYNDSKRRNMSSLHEIADITAHSDPTPVHKKTSVHPPTSTQLQIEPDLGRSSRAQDDRAGKLDGTYHYDDADSVKEEDEMTH